MRLELIETLWNVNTIASGTVMPPRASGINRNIVECKFVVGVIGNPPG